MLVTRKAAFKRKSNHSGKSILIKLAIVLKFVEHHSWLELLRRGWIVATKWFFQTRNIFIVKLSADTIIEPDSDLKFKELTCHDIDMMLEVMYLSRNGLEKRFEDKQRCFAIVDMGRIVAYFWAKFTNRSLDDMAFEFALRPKQVWFHNAITVKQARGKGYYPNIISYMAKTLKEEGFDEFFIDVEYRNQSSIRGVEKAGCIRVAGIRMRKLLSKVRYGITVYDENTWRQLLHNIKDDRCVQYIVED